MKRSPSISLLIVDDSPHMLSTWDSLIQYLNQDHLVSGLFDISSRMAHSGKEAVQEIENHRPEMILLDCHMPILDGYTVCQLTRQIQSYDPFIVMVSGDDTQAEKSRAFAVGANMFLLKHEISPDAFIDILLSFLEQSHIRMQTKVQGPTGTTDTANLPAEISLENLIETLQNTPSNAGNVIIEMAIRWREHFSRDPDHIRNMVTPAGEVFWRNVYHNLSSIHLKEAIAKWDRMTDLARALSLPPTEQNEQLKQLAFSQDKELQLAALQSLGLNRHEDAIYMLISAAHHDDEEVRLTAIAALGALSDHRAVPSLAAALPSPSSIIRYTALNALSAIGTPEAFHVIEQSLKSADPSLRIDAIRSFVLSGSKLESAQVMELLEPLVESEDDENVLYAIVMTLRDLKHRQALPILERLERHPHLVVSEAAHKAIARLKQNDL
jgi:HEAT repeat protein/DNA-binding NarL/FixJ family response regulator